MAINIAKYTAVGIDTLFWGLLDANGNFTGVDSNLLAGEDSGVAQLRGAQAFPYEPPEPDRIIIPGDNTNIDTYQFESDEPSAFVVEHGVNDLDFAAAAQGIPAEAVGDWDFMSLRPSPRTLANILLALISPAHSKESGSDGAAGFRIAILTNNQIIPLGPGGVNTKGEMKFRSSVTTQLVSKRPYGEMKTRYEDGFEFYSPYRVALHAYRDNGSGVGENFTVDYTPAGDETTNAVKAWKDGVLTAVTDVVPGTKTITVPAGGTSALWVVMYEYVV